MTIVAFDLEGTLTSGESWRGVRRYLHRRGRGMAVDRHLLPFVPRVLAAKVGWSEQEALRERWLVELARFLRGLSGPELQEMAEFVVTQEQWPRRHKPVLDEARAHQYAGRQIVLASAAYQPILAAFAERMGATAIGTRLEMVERRATGRVVDAVNSGAVKAMRLSGHACGDEIHSAYGDSISDLPMLLTSQRPVVVDPDTRLRAEALQRGWKIMWLDKDHSN